MAALYADILRAIEAHDYDVFRARAVVPGRRKLLLLARCLAGRGA
jgi:phytoene/squalene synthetase